MRKRDLLTRYRGDRQFRQWVERLRQMIADGKVSAQDLADAAIIAKVLEQQCEQERIDALITPSLIQ